MPDGEVRLYCTRISQAVSYFADDGEGGCVLWIEPGELANLSQATADELRPWILQNVAGRLGCAPETVEALSIKTLCQRLAWRPEPPRHPWQVRDRTPAPARRRATR